MLAVKLALDRVPAYQAEIKQWVHAQIGYHISFRRVSPAFRWYGPELYFDRLELRSKDDQHVLARAAGGRVAVDVWQLIRSGKLLAGRIELDAPNLVIARLGAARFSLASQIQLGGANSSSEALRLEDLPAGTLAIRNALVTLENWNSSLPQLLVPNVSLDLRRDTEGLAVAFAAQLPTVLGGTVSLRANASGAGVLKMLDWEARAHAHGISFAGWRLLLPEYLGSLDAGTGTFDMSAAGQSGALRSADLQFSAEGVATKLADGTVARFDQMSGALTMVHDGDRWTVTGRGVRATRHDPESAFAVTWRGNEAGLLDLRVRANYLRADTLLPLAGLLPQRDLRSRLHEVAPTGEWTDTLFALSRSAADAPWRFQVQGKFRSAGFAPVGRFPGLRGLSGSLAGNQSGGHVYLDSHGAVLAWPGQFGQPIELESLAARVYWRRNDAQLLVASPEWHVKSHDAEMLGKLSWQQPADGSSPLLTLVSTIENGNAANARSYFPRALLAPSALAWLDRAFVAGHLSRADALIEGPIKHFPFRDGSGLFLVRCALDSMTLDYSEGWPPAENVAGQAEFRNEGMSARLSSGRVGDIVLDSAEAHFPDFRSGQLKIKVAGRGDAAAALAYLRATPLDAQTGNAFSEAEAHGSLDASVDLFLPFRDFDHRRVLVHGHLEDATLSRRGAATQASGISGDFDIDNGQVSRASLRGELLGGPFQMQARAPRNKPPTRTELEFRGTLSAQALSGALSMPPGLSTLGYADWRAVLKITPEPARERSLHVSSTLAGFDMNWPAPLDKPAGAPLPSSFDIEWPASGGPRGRMALGSLVSGSFALESDADGVRLAHASFMFGAGEPGTGDAQIVNVGGAVGRVDLAGWLNLGSAGPDARPLSYYLRDARLDVAELDYLGLAFRDVSLRLGVNESGAFRIAVGGPNVAGTILVPAPDAAEPWGLQFDRLHVEAAGGDADGDVLHGAATAAYDSNDSNASNGANSRAPALTPRSVPALNFHASDLSLGERRFGDVRATVARLEDGIALKQLVANSGHFTLNAQGEWRGINAGMSRLSGSLASTDVQSTLKDLGYADVIQAKDGRMDFDLKWNGGPTADALAQITGHVKLSLDKGQVTGLKPGAGRMLGLASIAALPRRLALDFSDLTDKGLAFDSVRGDFDLRSGNAYTDDVLLKGPAAEIGLIGRVGLKNKDYDQTAVVTGSVGNSLSIPVASALVGGPVAGAVVLLFTQVFKQPLKGLARGYYRITGSWDNPTVERIKSADAAAATAEAPK